MNKIGHSNCRSLKRNRSKMQSWPGSIYITETFFTLVALRIRWTGRPTHCNKLVSHRHFVFFRYVFAFFCRCCLFWSFVFRLLLSSSDILFRMADTGHVMLCFPRSIWWRAFYLRSWRSAGRIAWRSSRGSSWTWWISRSWRLFELIAAEQFFGACLWAHQIWCSFWLERAFWLSFNLTGVRRWGDTVSILVRMLADGACELNYRIVLTASLQFAREVKFSFIFRIRHLCICYTAMIIRSRQLKDRRGRVAYNVFRRHIATI